MHSSGALFACNLLQEQLWTDNGGTFIYQAHCIYDNRKFRECSLRVPRDTVTRFNKHQMSERFKIRKNTARNLLRNRAKSVKIGQQQHQRLKATMT